MITETQTQLLWEKKKSVTALQDILVKPKQELALWSILMKIKQLPLTQKKQNLSSEEPGVDLGGRDEVVAPPPSLRSQQCKVGNAL